MENIQDIFEIAQQAAKKAGDHIANLRHSKQFLTNYKGDRNPVTTADTEAEAIIIELVRKHFPDHIFLAEETSNTITDPQAWLEPLWIIDPIDGTTNYLYDQPSVAVSIAFANAGKVEAGVVNAPFQDEIFTAIRGQGAFLNDKRIQVSTQQDLGLALIGTGFPYQRDRVDDLVEHLRLVLQNCRDIRRHGAASLDACWVACARLDAYYETVSIWDIAAGGLIAREAGAVVDHICGVPKDFAAPAEFYAENLVIANPVIARKLIELLQQQ